MSQYQLFSPDTEVIGQAVIDFEQAVGSEQFMHILKKHGLSNVQPDTWYPAQQWVNVLNDINELGNIFNFVSIGMTQVKNLHLPAEFEQLSLMEKVHMADDIYNMNYRGSDIGSVHAETVSETHAKLIIRVFEPDDLWYGAAYGFMRQFAPEGTKFRVYYDEDSLQQGIDRHGEKTIIHMTW
ncbi:MAG: hypothetical protein ACFE0Q_00125 [Anaerolineae bacterium]